MHSNLDPLNTYMLLSMCLIDFSDIKVTVATNEIPHSESHPIIISVKNWKIFPKSASNDFIRTKYISGRKTALKFRSLLSKLSQKSRCINTPFWWICFDCKLSVSFALAKEMRFFQMIRKENQLISEVGEGQNYVSSSIFLFL